MLLVNTGFPHAEDFLPKLSVIWARALKIVRQPFSGPKKLIEYRFEGVPKYLLDRGTYMSGAGPHSGYCAIRNYMAIQEVRVYPRCIYIQGVSGGLVNILGGGSMDYSE
jgi:hypothetical protein